MWHISLYALFLMISIFAFTSMMDRHPIAFPVELLKLVIGIALIYQMDGWYMMDNYFSGATYMMIIYMSLSVLLTGYFSFVEKTGQNLTVSA